MAKKNKRILIMEDDEFFSEIYADSFPNDDYEIVLAKDGEEGIALLDKSDFDLIVLDIMMPKVNGWEVLEYINKKKKLK